MKSLITVSALVLLVSILTFQNCSGYRSREVDFAISKADVEHVFHIFESKIQQDGNPAAIQAVNNFWNLYSQPGSTIYYSVTPSSLGQLDTVVPLSLQDMTSKQVGTLQKIFVFFVVSKTDAGFQGSLIVTGLDLLNNGASTTPTTNGTTPTGTTFFRLTTPSVVRAAATTTDPGTGTTTDTPPTPDTNGGLPLSPGDSGTDPGSVTENDFSFVFIGQPSGNSSLGLGQDSFGSGGVTDGLLRIPLIIDDGNANVVMYCDPVSTDGEDLADGPIKCDVNKIIDSSGTEISIGSINALVPPE